MKLKKVIPTSFHGLLRKLINRLLFFRYISYDYSNVGLSRNSEGHYSRVIRYYHRLEKALSKDPFTKGRGYRAAYSLLNSLRRVDRSAIDVGQLRVAYDVLNLFFERNSDKSSKAFREFNDLPRLDNNGLAKGGVKKIDRSEFSLAQTKGFEELAKSRYSVRYFSGEKVRKDSIQLAVEIAGKTPSACNRQPWKVWHVVSEDLISYFKRIHKGFSLDQQNLTNLLVVAVDRRAYSYPLERNQAYVDGGLYSMSLIYALTSLGLATCALNSNLPLRTLKDFKTRLDIPNEYTVIMFIAVGNYKDLNHCPKSYRSSVKEKLTVI